jgi:hypothetical protein
LVSEVETNQSSENVVVAKRKIVLRVVNPISAREVVEAANRKSEAEQIVVHRVLFIIPMIAAKQKANTRAAANS